MPARPMLALTLAAALVGAGCGDDDDAGSPDPATEQSDRPARPPEGWRTFANRRAGFTIAVPRNWSTHRRQSATLVRSPDRLLAVTVAADRGKPGRDTDARSYARRTFEALPGFDRVRPQRVAEVRASPYESARVDGRGRLADGGRAQTVTVAAFRRPGRVTYTVVAFGADVGRAPPHAGSLRVLLASLRGRRPEL